MRGSRRLAAERNTRSATRNTGRRTCGVVRQLMAEDDDLQVLRRGRPEQQEQKLQDALKRDVKNGQKHGTSANTTRGPLFYGDRINAPHRAMFGWFSEA